MCVVCGCGERGAAGGTQGATPAGVRVDARSGDLHYGAGAARVSVPGMSAKRTIRLEADVLGANDRVAARNRAHFALHGVTALNLVSSPGSGKTTLLVATIDALRRRRPGVALAVIEGDQQTSRDADRIRATGAPAIQVNTGKGCHLDAPMVAEAFARLPLHRHEQGDRGGEGHGRDREDGHDHDHDHGHDHDRGHWGPPRDVAQRPAAADSNANANANVNRNANADPDANAAPDADAYADPDAAADADPPPTRLLFIENVGNLVCPALWDLGEAAKVACLSVTEGDDKPLKYPDMFAAARLLLLNKVDLLPYVDFDVARCIDHARRVNPRIEVILVSATRGDGIEAWLDWIELTAADLQRRTPAPAAA